MVQQRTNRIYQPKDSLLFRLPPGSMAVAFNGTGLPQFTIPTPSARLLAKVALIFWQQVTPQVAGFAGSLPSLVADPNAGGFMSPIYGLLWLSEKTEGACRAVTSFLIGSDLFHPQAIPLNQTIGDPTTSSNFPGLGGASFDVQGSQDFIEGAFNAPNIAIIPPGSANPGLNLSLRVRYEVNQTEMCQDEFDALKPLLSVSVGNPVIVPGVVIP